MKFLVITQDLRISGTSAGIGRRSFIAKLKKAYPYSVIDVLYISHFNSSNDDLELLPVNNITREVINNSIPFHVKWINRIATRVLDILYAEHYINRKFARLIEEIDYKYYDHIFVFSSGIKHETILATENLPILRKAIIIFHDPYPHAWYDVKTSKIHKNEFLRLRKMIGVVKQAKACGATAYYMAKDLQYLYASDKIFYTLPHYFEPSAFNLTYKDQVRKKEAKLQISYHGALMLGRNLFNVLEAYSQLIQEVPYFQIHTEFVLRVKGEGIRYLKRNFGDVANIIFLDTLDFSNSYNEQAYQSDICVILENGPYYSNILPGKVPFLASTGKPVLIISPERSELKRILEDNNQYIADMNSVKEIKQRLLDLIRLTLEEYNFTNPFKEYFGDHFFKKNIDEMING